MQNSMQNVQQGLLDQDDEIKVLVLSDADRAALNAQASRGLLLALAAQGAMGLAAAVIAGVVGGAAAGWSALAGAGIALLPDARAAALVRAGRLVRVLPDYTGGETGLFVVHPASRLLPAKARAFRDFVLEHIEVLTIGRAAPSPLARATVRCAVKKRAAKRK